MLRDKQRGEKKAIKVLWLCLVSLQIHPLLVHDLVVTVYLFLKVKPRGKTKMFVQFACSHCVPKKKKKRNFREACTNRNTVILSRLHVCITEDKEGGKKQTSFSHSSQIYSQCLSLIRQSISHIPVQHLIHNRVTLLCLTETKDAGCASANRRGVCAQNVHRWLNELSEFNWRFIKGSKLYRKQNDLLRETAVI